MPDFADTALVVLAAGFSKRFGAADKLSQPLNGQPVVLHVLDTVSSLAWGQRLLICRNQPWASAFADKGFEIIINGDPETGLSGSLRLAAAAASRTRMLICLGDMPFVTTAHFAELDTQFRQHDGKPTATSSADYLGPPVLFRKLDLAEQVLTGDQGARRLLQSATKVSCRPQECADIDTAEDLRRFQLAL